MIDYGCYSHAITVGRCIFRVLTFSAPACSKLRLLKNKDGV